MIDHVGRADQPVKIKRDYEPPMRQLSANSVRHQRVHGNDGRPLGFFGALLISFGNVVRHPRRFRFNAVVTRFDVVGVRALAIVGLMSFLVGIVIAQQGAVQLRQFGAEVFTVNLIGRSAVKELGVLMTAIMVAGRSGSAFAAQIGSMKLNEEVDAITIGVSPMKRWSASGCATVDEPLLALGANISVIGRIFCCLRWMPPSLSFSGSAKSFDQSPLAGLSRPVFGIIAIAGDTGLQVKGRQDCLNYHGRVLESSW